MSFAIKIAIKTPYLYSINHKIISMRISVELSGYTKSSNGLQQVRIRTSHHGQRSFFNTGIYIPENVFDEDSKTIKKIYPNAKLLNEKINRKISEVTHAFNMGGQYNVSVLNRSLGDAILEFIRAKTKSSADATIENYMRVYNIAKEEFPAAKLTDLNSKFIDNIKQTFIDRGLKNSTINLYITGFISVFNFFKKKGIVSEIAMSEVDKLKVGESIKSHLQLEQLQEFSNYIATLQPGSNRTVALYFLLGCRTGLRYSDLCKLDQYKLTSNNELLIVTKKSKKIVSLKLNENTLAIYKDCLAAGSLLNSSKKVSKEIKSLRLKLNWDDEITFHSSRHTFAIMCAKMGISIEVTSRLMGHSDIKTTAIYYKIANEQLNAAMDKIDF
ncbi:tyrosine-type recombinase/integrase [Polluticaenibacter yanchengensis]|uniref:Tyrosine-type recombinase/integrase n=1 Tax=Polluticaenibacter yanchengensis TaxID=3014562 RepID=A0ABT4UK03_9BACT|nr:tyrosine-type recombinase/integrase [Chitinophagaceae bacterium LY-5]